MLCLRRAGWRLLTSGLVWLTVSLPWMPGAFGGLVLWTCLWTIRSLRLCLGCQTGAVCACLPRLL